LGKLGGTAGKSGTTIDRGTRFEVLESVAFCHFEMLPSPLPRHKQGSFDMTRTEPLRQSLANIFQAKSYQRHVIHIIAGIVFQNAEQRAGGSGFGIDK
jgi:hypothetical protein